MPYSRASATIFSKKRQLHALRRRVRRKVMMSIFGFESSSYRVLELGEESSVAA